MVDEDVRRATVSRLESLRRQRGELYACLLEVLSHSDPIGLLAMDCPRDEYVPEAERIFKPLREVDSMEALQDLMHGVFVDMFNADLAGPKSQYHGMARTFWARWKQSS